MYQSTKISHQDKKEFYRLLSLQLQGLIEGENDPIANLANSAALLFDQLPHINWAGYYLVKDHMLLLGPFGGKPACVRIPFGRGVCGRVAETKRPFVVFDVHQFPGHIACDAASRSEIVIPLLYQDKLLGVLDVDSPITGRFDALDEEGLGEFAQILINGTNWE